MKVMIAENILTEKFLVKNLKIVGTKKLAEIFLVLKVKHFAIGILTQEMILMEILEQFAEQKQVICVFLQQLSRICRKIRE